jgi:predicted DNA-binding antitoxin AbrB/MazE fold protein
MTRIVSATFDGEVLRLDEPVDLEPNTRVRVTIETPEDTTSEASFLDVAASLNLEGPSDWSARLEDYLYGRDSTKDE